MGADGVAATSLFVTVVRVKKWGFSQEDGDCGVAYRSVTAPDLGFEGTANTAFRAAAIATLFSL